MTVKQKLRSIIVKKTLILIGIAAVLGVLCYFTSSHERVPNYDNAHLIYTLVSLGLSLVVLLFVAWKMRYFHLLFGKEIIATVVDTKYERFGNYSKVSIKNVNNFAIFVQPDGTQKIIGLRFSTDKISSKVYEVGDRIHLLKGTNYPINLTREAEQHICPICGHDSCLDDYCPNCKIKY